MKKLTILLFSLLISTNCFGDDQFFNFIQEKTVKFAFDNGDIHTATFAQNELGVVTGIYRDEVGNTVKGMSLSFITSGEGKEYLRLFKGLKSPVGTYTHPMLVFIPVEFTPGLTRTYVDARWGSYKRPLVFIRD